MANAARFASIVPKSLSRAPSPSPVPIPLPLPLLAHPLSLTLRKRPRSHGNIRISYILGARPRCRETIENINRTRVGRLHPQLPSPFPPSRSITLPSVAVRPLLRMVVVCAMIFLIISCHISFLPLFAWRPPTRRPMRSLLRCPPTDLPRRLRPSLARSARVDRFLVCVLRL